jgi:hypothetical protein
VTARQASVRAVAVLAALAAVIAALLGIARLTDGPDYADVTSATLSGSLTRETGGGSDLGVPPEPCHQRRGAWSCFVANSGSPGGAQYRVSLRDRHCWDAIKTRRVSEENPLPVHASGCVTSDDERGQQQSDNSPESD